MAPNKAKIAPHANKKTRKSALGLPILSSARRHTHLIHKMALVLSLSGDNLYSVLTTPLQLKTDTPHKLILLSPDSSEEAMLRTHLNKEEAGKYSILHVDSLEQLRSFDLGSLCDAVLLDMRFGRQYSMENIRCFDGLHSSVALIALCSDHEQLMDYKEDIHLLDDYILAEHLVNGELPTRITHAIRRRLKEVELLHEKTLLQSLLDNIPHAIFFKDRASRFTKVNRTMQLNYGQNHGSIIGKTDFDTQSSHRA